MPEMTLPDLEAVVTLNPCQTPPPIPVVTTGAPVRERQLLYLSAREYLYAINAVDGTARWCQEAQLLRTREPVYHPMMSYPPPPRLTFGAPRVVAGVTGANDEAGAVYVAMDGFGTYTCAFAAEDGAFRWWSQTDGRVSSMPFLDYAAPLVDDDRIYSGTYALGARDGSVLWRTDIDTRTEGALALHAISDETLYATTQRGAYAINAQDGHVRWLYQPDTHSMLREAPVVADRLLFVGTESVVCALDAATGAEVWRAPLPLGSYRGAVIQHETLYVNAGPALCALDTKSGSLRWRHQFPAVASSPPTLDRDVLYVNITADGAYALSSRDGAVLWRHPLEISSGTSRNVGPVGTFASSVVLEDAVYVARLGIRARGVLFALDARTGAECWHTAYPFGGALLAMRQ